MQCVERNPIKDTLVLIMSDKRAIHWGTHKTKHVELTFE